jgi:type IV secretory pathway VirB2 component (pilin)
MKNWKTTVGAIVAAAGLSMQASDNANVKLAGQIIAGIGVIFFGASAKDNNVTGGTKQQ